MLGASISSATLSARDAETPVQHRLTSQHTPQCGPRRRHPSAPGLLRRELAIRIGNPADLAKHLEHPFHANPRLLCSSDSACVHSIGGHHAIEIAQFPW